MDVNEEWRPAYRIPNHDVSSLGRVRAHVWNRRPQSPPRIIPCGPDGAGYPQVSIDNQVHRVHSLVAEAFLGPRQPGLHVRHLNGLKDDNRVENLAWGTPQENMRDKCAGAEPKKFPLKKTRAKLSIEDVIAVRKRREAGEKYWDIAMDFGTTPTNVRQICKRQTWQWVP